MKIVRVGLVGTGFASWLHMNAYLSIPEAKVISVCSRTKEKVETFARNYDVPSYYTDYEMMIDKEDLDFVDICTPGFLHKEMTLRAFDLGKHVLCEKPIAIKLEDADEMIAQAEKKGLKLMIAHCLRFDPVHIDIKKILEKDTVGKARYIRAVKWFVKYGKELPVDHDYTKFDRFGGVYIDACIHNADVMRWYFGCEPLEVFSVGERLIREDWDIEDFVAILYRFENGAVGFLETCAVAPHGHPTLRDVTGHLEILGTKGSIRLDDSVSAAELATDEKYTYLHPEGEVMYLKEIKHFVDCVLNDRDPVYPATEARAALEMCEAARRSSLSRQPLRLPLQIESD